MQYYSLHHQSPVVDFKEATINGQAPDKGLYFPVHIPLIDKNWMDTITDRTDIDIAFDIIKPFVGNCINEQDLYKIVQETINFDFQLIKLNNHISSLELYHGPTLAFKDVGARFMSRCLRYFVKNNNKKITVLVATSGDTGGAVANGFYNIDGAEVIILYPSGKVSTVQEKQLTTLGKNITALEVQGSFDDCQQMVKAAFADEDLQKKYFLTSANSINVARWLPQQFYYFYAYKQWLKTCKTNHQSAPVFSVPSGNFGNICAGILAHIRGLPVHHFIAACNANDVVPNYLHTGHFQTKETIATISNAMDVSNPSNFVRILQLFENNMDALKNKLSSISISDELTRNTIETVYREYNYLCDPHGAVAYYALDKYLNEHLTLNGIFLETAHPIKFYDVVEPIVENKIELPESIAIQMELPKQSTIINKGENELKDFLMGRSTI